MLLPESFKRSRYVLLDKNVLPRRHRGATKWDEEAPPVHSLIEAAKQRTRRLLRSLDELEREVLGCTSQLNISTSQMNIHANPRWDCLDDLGGKWWHYWKIAHDQARRKRVPENEMKEEFRESRRIGLDYSDLDNRSWVYAQLCRLSRHKWGQHMRSNMDWNWDLGTCMKRLFKVEKQIRVGPSLTASTTSIALDVAAGPGWTLKISMREAQDGLPKEVQVAYMTRTGETQYMSFVPAGSGPACRRSSRTASTGSSADSEQILDPTVTQQDLGHRKGSFGGKHEFENPGAGTSSSDTSQLIAREDAPAEEVYDARFDDEGSAH